MLLAKLPSHQRKKAKQSAPDERVVEAPMWLDLRRSDAPHRAQAT